MRQPSVLQVLATVGTFLRTSRMRPTLRSVTLRLNYCVNEGYLEWKEKTCCVYKDCLLCKIKVSCLYITVHLRTNAARYVHSGSCWTRFWFLDLTFESSIQFAQSRMELLSQLKTYSSSWLIHIRLPLCIDYVVLTPGVLKEPQKLLIINPVIAWGNRE